MAQNYVTLYIIMQKECNTTNTFALAIPGGAVSVGQSNDGQVDVGLLLDCLVIGAGVGHNEQTGLLEGLLDLSGW